MFYLRNANDSGFADECCCYGVGGSGMLPIVGDWNGDGMDTLGLYNPTTATFYLSDSNAGGYANNTFVYGPANSGMVPIVGDWDGNGTDTVGLYNPATSMFYLKNSNSAGFADLAFAYGPSNSGWTPVAGDWNGAGKDTIGLYNPTTSMFYLRNSNTTGFSDTAFVYGPAQSGWKPLTGDWNGAGTDTIGLYNPATSMFYLRNSNTTGFSDAAFAYGPAGASPPWTPLAGNWTTSGQALLAANQVVASPNTPALTQSDLQPGVGGTFTSLTTVDQGALVVDLQPLQPGTGALPGFSPVQSGNLIHIDTNTASHDSLIDSTLASAYNAASSGGTQPLPAVDPRVVDRMDPSTVVDHELGNVTGLQDLDTLANDVMSGVLGSGIARNSSHSDAALASL